MRAGQYFRLKANTLAVDATCSKATTVDVPMGAVIRATGVQRLGDHRMIEVEWQDCRLFMFVVDVQERGERIMGTDGHQAPSSDTESSTTCDADED